MTPDVPEVLRLHGMWHRGEPDGVRADLVGAYLMGADLTGANLDFAAWPLWCGSRGVVTDARLKIQLLAHVAVMAGDTDPDLAELLGSDLFRRVVRKCHRAKELGLIEEEEEEHGES